MDLIKLVSGGQAEPDAEDAARDACRAVFAHCNGKVAQLARLLGESVATVSAWKQRGKISPWGADKIERAGLPFTKEQIRPDVFDWEGLLARKPGRV